MLPPRRRWVLARAELGCAGLHCCFPEISFDLRLALTFRMRQHMFAYAYRRCNHILAGCI
jgi:hypothetical protein